MKALTKWIKERYDFVSVPPPYARKTARQFLLDSELPADERSIETVLKQLRSMNLMLGRVNNPGARLRLVRKVVKHV